MENTLRIVMQNPIVSIPIMLLPTFVVLFKMNFKEMKIYSTAEIVLSTIEMIYVVIVFFLNYCNS